jgi:aminomethyltransferase
MPQTKDRTVPVNLRQSGDSDVRMLIGTRVRKSPFWHKSVEHGVRAVTVYNHMYHPRLYFSPEMDGLMGEYYYLTHHVTLWNVAVERQIRVKGPEALDFVNAVVTRDMKKKMPVDKARYVILCDANGGIINDPVLLRVAEDEFWFSISDSDLALWFKGLNQGWGMDVEIGEIDVSPVQVQGPKAQAMMTELFGPELERLGYYRLWQTQLHDMDVVISRTGFSGEVGYEIYLRNATRDADAFWDTLVEAGGKHDLRVIAPGHIRRIEAGILSYGQDMDAETNPFEVPLEWQFDPDKPDWYVGKAALHRIHQQGVTRKLVGLVMGGPRITWYNSDFWPVRDQAGERDVGYVTSAFYSPKMGCNIALAMLPLAYTEPGQRLHVDLPAEAGDVPARVHQVPFYDPDKQLPRGQYPGTAAAQ